MERAAEAGAGPKGFAAVRANAVDGIREMIIDGRLRPGDRIVERDLAERLQVSRYSVREAVRALTYEGFLVAESPRRIVVRRLSRRDVEELFDVREGLEMLATGLAARQADADGVSRLEKLLEDTAAATDDAVLHTLNADFHLIMTEIAGNSLLRAMAFPLEGRLRWLYQHNGDWDRLLCDHRALLAAVVAGDEERARVLAVEHARTSRAHTLANLFPAQEPGVPGE
ncbi:GntR family transcriptional regulator [Amycolatopsis jiangsuensis]|uniref:DNA-binding GntR family transcriptional regulator n=1 Tax=Amycolatopsis jiangsuensis TaxID=1181879 RepID=A0A840IR43_9PSEU|nr:GntR family transcriptional regulator [Amycolatopsis jiangsuensis]MBB4683847.1 DNA-binding GntR family transcriptional regulator [Amycolatopsis jiangsuensis]